MFVLSSLKAAYLPLHTAGAGIYNSFLVPSFVTNPLESYGYLVAGPAATPQHSSTAVC